MNRLQDSQDIQLIYEPYYHKASLTIQRHNVKAALIEVAEAKEKKEIDDFVFFDVTVDYLASKLISI